MVWLQTLFTGWIALFGKIKKLRQCHCRWWRRNDGAEFGPPYGKIVCDLLAAREIEPSIAGFKPDRFDR